MSQANINKLLGLNFLEKLLKDDYKILKNFKFSENHKFQKMGEVWH